VKKDASDSLSLFHPVIQAWFREEKGVPTAVQSAAWPLIAQGRHVLATAPTGTGKTLAAFLWALNNLVTGTWDASGLRVLYISPLKALNTDMRRNLLDPLAALERCFAAAGLDFPVIAVETRSGDTPQNERRRMIRRPPQILATTPESLNLMLNSPRGRSIFSGLQTVILDEIHAVADSKRGVHLMTAVERLVPLVGEFQRVALSATVNPVELVAEMVGGSRLEKGGPEPRYANRPVCVVQALGAKEIVLEVRQPYTGRERDESPWHKVAAAVHAIVQRNRSTLIFVNSRRMSERITLLLNQAAGETIAYAHHGSLSREVRTVVEERLKAGELRAIVATNSLELGIDIGALDEVVLIETPPSASSTLQRLGRSGHTVNAVSRGVLFPTHGLDLLAATVMAQAVSEKDIEPVRPLTLPLDVLAQVIAAMTAVDAWKVDELYHFVRCCHAYRDLSRRQFDLVLDMLTGRYADERLRDLQPLIDVDWIDGVATARPGTLRRINTAGGTIPDRGYYTLRREQTRARIGELDEEFVWERRTGEVFTLGSQSWQIARITHNDVLVRPAPPGRTGIPFWRAESRNLPAAFAERLAEFLERVERSGPVSLASECEAAGLQREAIDALQGFLASQTAATQALPHRHLVLIEHTSSEQEGRLLPHIVLHTVWGGGVNRPYGLALAQAWEEQLGERPEIIANDTAIAIVAEAFPAPETLLSLVSPDNLDGLLRRSLERSGYFGARFRESAATALQLPRGGFAQRTPLWLTRMRAKKLLEKVKHYEDFPLLVETWRACLRDDFDLGQLRERLRELGAGSIAVHTAHTPAPSPFASGLTWSQTNQLLYMDDTAADGAPSKLREDLIAEVAAEEALRPRLPLDLVERFEQKAQRLYPGYAPTSAAELLFWLKERMLLTEPEWEQLLAAAARDGAPPRGPLLRELGMKAVYLRLGQSANLHVAPAESLPRLVKAFGLPLDEIDILPLGSEEAAGPEAMFRQQSWQALGGSEGRLANWLAEWLRFFGPVDVDDLPDLLPVQEPALEEALQSLLEQESIVLGHLTDGATEMQVCDRGNFELLLRIKRSRARSTFQPLPLRQLPLFLATHQGLTQPGTDRHDLEQRLECLLCLPQATARFEQGVLPARMRPFEADMLYQVAHDSDLLWFGCGKGLFALSFPEQLDLCLPLAVGAKRAKTDEAALERLFASPSARYAFGDLLRENDGEAAELAGVLWGLFWDGRVSNDSLATLHAALKPLAAVSKPAGRRAGFQRWRSLSPLSVAWFALPPVSPPGDALEAEERSKDRVRVLLSRYGVLFRELLQNELPPFQWKAVFRTLRIMELAGEVVNGQFFEGVPGPQFASPEAVARLQQGLPRDAVYWMAADDPASACGLGLEGLREELPRRLSTTTLVYHGEQLVLVAQGGGKSLDIRVPPEERALPEYFHPLEMLIRPCAARSYISLDAINGREAASSPYLASLREHFDVSVNPHSVGLFRRVEP
jgi:ATP-dependent Lhr-like helicase